MVVVNARAAGTYRPQPFIWHESGTKTVLPLPTGATFAYATDISADGTTVAGWTNLNNLGRYWRWSASTGTVLDGMPGGYMDYRAWVVASLQELPALFDFRVISGASWSGQTDLLRAIAAEGGQTIDVAYLWEHHGGRTRGKGAQDLIESYVLDRMRKLDQRKPVWIEDSTDRRVMQVLPEAIRAAARKSAHCMISAPMAERIKRASSETRFMREHVGALVQSVVKGARCLATGEKDTLRRPAKRGSVDEAMVALIAAQDRDNEQRLRGFRGEDLTVLRVPALDAATLREAAKSLVLEHS